MDRRVLGPTHMSQRPLPPRDELARMFAYNPKTGELLWRTREATTFFDGKKYSKERKAKIFNARFPGRSAACFSARRGTREKPSSEGRVVPVTTINNSHHITARVIWKLVHDDEPEQVISKNGNPSDLRLSNLQASSEIYKSKHNSTFSHNTSGERGVSWHKQTNRWRAYIKVNGKTLHLGLFTTLERAVDARKKAEARHGWRSEHLAQSN